MVGVSEALLDITAMQAAYESAMEGHDTPDFVLLFPTDENLWRFRPWIMLQRSRELKPGKYRRWMA